MNERLARCLAFVAIVATTVGFSGVAHVYAWDSLTSSNSHSRITQGAVNELLLDGSVPESIKAPIRESSARIVDMGDNEDTHKQTYSPTYDPINLYSRATGNNPGSNHVELWWMSVVAKYRLWQTTGDTKYRDDAYELLGKMLHDIEDMGTPPHAYQNQHGVAPQYRVAAFEVLSAATSYDTSYYQRPYDFNHPGKNIVDGWGTVANPGWHTDGAQIRW
ncbi:MAG: hypothetical protein WCI74_17265, partial [Actinomycetes bacterium]